MHLIKAKLQQRNYNLEGETLKKLHIGRHQEDCKCQQMYIDSWSEEENKDEENRRIEINETYTDEELMEEIEEAKYLGDIISNDGKNINKTYVE